MLFGLDDIRQRRIFIQDDGGDGEHKRREHKRLDALIAYCEAPTCRRRTLLAYFGETIDPCGNCDVCIDPVEMVEGQAVGQQALSAVLRTGQRFGAAHIIDVLRGAKTEKILSLGHDELPTYGVGAARDKNAWRSIIRQLVAAGFLNLDIAGYGGLTITATGRDLLRGAAAFSYRADTMGRASSAARKSKATPITDLDEAGMALLGVLKDLRRALASERKVPAYIVFSDRSLHDMAERQPATTDAFADIHGVGAAKLRDFADIFMAKIKAHCAP
jgi:ATP-dependent DNA helicase RecQ